ncbi:MAG: PHP domain-containing protein [Methanomicrobiales archaeon]|nr:PHP domain-containing protein [Methanomicrobiales archaeon]
MTGLAVSTNSESEDIDSPFWRFDMHVHSWHSGDSGTNPSKIVELYRGQRILSLVTDHNTLAGSQAVYGDLRSEFPELPLILSEEIMTDSGEIIGLFLSEEVHPYLSAAETVDIIHDQGGLALIPHPFCSYRRTSAIRSDVLDEIIDRVDIIEGYNARTGRDEDNLRAREYAMAHKKPVSVGSDAHNIHELGRCYLECDPFTTPRELLASLSNGRPEFCRMDFSIHKLTKLVKAVRRDRLLEE